MDILHMVDLRQIISNGATIDLNHVKSEIPVPFVLKDPIRAGPQKNVSFSLIYAPKATCPSGSHQMGLHLYEHDHRAIT